MNIERRAIDWMTGDDTGASSMCLCRVMLGLGPDKWKSSPSDPSDLGRCLRLLEIIPEWKTRIGEMASVSPEWEALVQVWDRLRNIMDDEVGINWSKGRSAPSTYAAMKAALDHTIIWHGCFGTRNDAVYDDHKRRYERASA